MVLSQAPHTAIDHRGTTCPAVGAWGTTCQAQERTAPYFFFNYTIIRRYSFKKRKLGEEENATFKDRYVYVSQATPVP